MINCCEKKGSCRTVYKIKFYTDYAYICVQVFKDRDQNILIQKALEKERSNRHFHLLFYTRCFFLGVKSCTSLKKNLPIPQMARKEKTLAYLTTFWGVKSSRGVSE